MASSHRHGILGRGLLLALSLAAADSPALAQSYVFGRADFATGAAPSAVVTGDFNGDGKLDLAVANSGDNTVSVLIGKPDGTFQPRVDYKVGASPSAVATGDFNGDGKLDLAVANNADSTVSILLGNGDGTFQTAVNYGTGLAPSSVAVGDFNGDKKLDLAVANSGSDSVSVLLGRGDGTFAPNVPYPTGKGPVSVATGDLNGDGKLDLAVADVAGSAVSILLGNGDGTFGAAVPSAGLFEFPSFVVMGDFNGDMKLDLAVMDSNFGAAVDILLGNGDGTFSQAPDGNGYYFLGFLVGFLSGGSSVVVGDFNRDGKLDLAVPASSIPCTLLGNGDGTFQGPGNCGGSSSAAAVAVGDFNGDGGLDLAVAGASNTVSILLGHFDGTFDTKRSLVGSVYSSLALGQAGGFNADGIVDLAVPFTAFDPSVPQEISGIFILHGNGDGTFQGGVNYPTGTGPDSVTIGDFNADGKLDLAVVNSGCPPFSSCGATTGSVSILLGNGDGTFRAAVNYDVGISPSSAAIGDFNGDGKLDLAVANSGGNTMSVLLGNGDGTFQSHVDYAAATSWVVSGDFNEDGKLDLATAAGILIGNGDGTFQAINNAAPGGSFGLAADFNHDGKLDLAVTGTSSVSLLLGNGNGTFAPAVAYSTASASVMAMGDFSGSGKLDLAVPGSILLGKGDGTFQVLAGPDFFPQSSLIATDFDGDGTTDLAGIGSVPVPSRYQTPAVDVFLNKPVIALYPDQLTFQAEPVGATSAAQTITVSNPGPAPLKVSGINVTGAFTQTNDCVSTLASGAACTITVTSTQAGEGISTGAVSITDNAPGSPHLISLTASSEPAVSLTPGSLTFVGQEVSTASAKQALTLSNTGSQPLMIASLAASGDFAQTNTCGSSLSAGASCTISVTFTPTAGGTRTGTITITDNAPGSPQQVSLSGVGQDFAIGFSRTTQSVIAGQTASYELLISPLGGFSQAVALSCSGAPQFANCVVSPASIAPANGPVSVSVKVSTRASSQTSASNPAPRLPPLGPTKGPWLWLGALSAGLLAVAARRRRLVLASALMLLSVTMWVACGGGAAPSIWTPGTPNGTFTLSVSATSGPLSHSATTTLVVSGSAGPT